MSTDHWIEQNDPTTGRTFYTNQVTGESSWTNPNEGVAQSEWVASVDPTSGRTFYTNSTTGESSWVEPTVTAEAEKEGKSEETAVENGEVIEERVDPTTGRSYYVNIATGETSWIDPRLNATTTTAEETPETIEERTDPTTERKYYVNVTTGETSWTDPREMEQMEEIKEAQKVEEKDDASSEWIIGIDPSSGRHFYQNKLTGASQWLRPAVLGPELSSSVTSTDQEKEAPSAVSSTSASSTTTTTKTATVDDDDHQSHSWEERTDPASGRVFYVNIKTNQSSWEKPAEIANEASDNNIEVDDGNTYMWQEHLHPEYNRSYYVHKGTGQSVWEPPEEGYTPLKKVQKEDEMSSSSSSSNNISPTEASRRRSIQIAKYGDWVEMEDPIEKKTFFLNERTTEITYEKPSEWLNSDTNNSSNGSGGGSSSSSSSSKLEQNGGSLDNNEKSGGVSAAMRRRSVIQKEDGNWQLLLDPQTNREFYHNKITNESRWSRPDSFPKTAQRNKIIKREVDDETRRSSVVIENRGGDWVRMEDKRTKKTFYYNNKTEGTQWEKPADYNDNITNTMSSDGQQNGMKTRMLGWVEKFDPASGRNYYFNEGTGE
jgi:hypothetical protein